MSTSDTALRTSRIEPRVFRGQMIPKRSSPPLTALVFVYHALSLAVRSAAQTYPVDLVLAPKCNTDACVEHSKNRKDNDCCAAPWEAGCRAGHRYVAGAYGCSWGLYESLRSTCCVADGGSGYVEGDFDVQDRWHLYASAADKARAAEEEEKLNAVEHARAEQRAREEEQRKEEERVYAEAVAQNAAQAASQGADQSKCSDHSGNDCCAHATIGEPQTCRDGYIPSPDPPGVCSSTFGLCGILFGPHFCYACYPPASASSVSSATTRVADQSKCADRGNDCCAHSSWHEPQACADGYVAIADSSPWTSCSSLWADCAWHAGGKGCYACYEPAGHTTSTETTAQVADQSKCTDWGNDCCAHPDWHEPQSCKDGYVAKPDTTGTCKSLWKDCIRHEGGKGCYACYPPETVQQPAPQPQPSASQPQPAPSPAAQIPAADFHTLCQHARDCECRSTNTEIQAFGFQKWDAPGHCHEGSCYHGYKDSTRCGDTGHAMNGRGDHSRPLNDGNELNVIGEAAWCYGGRVDSKCPVRREVSPTADVAVAAADFHTLCQHARDCECRSTNTEIQAFGFQNWDAPGHCHEGSCYHGYKDSTRCGDTGHAMNGWGDHYRPLNDGNELNVIGEDAWCYGGRVDSKCPVRREVVPGTADHVAVAAPVLPTDIEDDPECVAAACEEYEAGRRDADCCAVPEQAFCGSGHRYRAGAEGCGWELIQGQRSTCCVADVNHSSGSAGKDLFTAKKPTDIEDNPECVATACEEYDAGRKDNDCCAVPEMAFCGPGHRYKAGAQGCGWGLIQGQRSTCCLADVSYPSGSAGKDAVETEATAAGEGPTTGVTFASAVRSAVKGSGNPNAEQKHNQKEDEFFVGGYASAGADKSKMAFTVKQDVETLQAGESLECTTSACEEFVEGLKDADCCAIPRMAFCGAGFRYVPLVKTCGYNLLLDLGQRTTCCVADGSFRGGDSGKRWESRMKEAAASTGSGGAAGGASGDSATTSAAALLQRTTELLATHGVKSEVKVKTTAVEELPAGIASAEDLKQNKKYKDTKASGIAMALALSNPHDTVAVEVSDVKILARRALSGFDTGSRGRSRSLVTQTQQGKTVETTFSIKSPVENRGDALADALKTETSSLMVQTFTAEEAAKTGEFRVVSVSSVGVAEQCNSGSTATCATAGGGGSAATPSSSPATSDAAGSTSTSTGGAASSSSGTTGPRTSATASSSSQTGDSGESTTKSIDTTLLLAIGGGIFGCALVCGVALAYWYLGAKAEGGGGSNSKSEVDQEKRGQGRELELPKWSEQTPNKKGVETSLRAGEKGAQRYTTRVEVEPGTAVERQQRGTRLEDGGKRVAVFADRKNEDQVEKKKEKKKRRVVLENERQMRLLKGLPPLDP